MSDFILYLKLGLFHVLDWSATDHLLFLVVLTLPFTVRAWKHLLWLVTLFTIGHTLSLILAAYGFVSVSSRWVEFLIPLTIMIAALSNIISGGHHQNRNYGLVWALLFGLIHGFGFASYFKLIAASHHNKLLSLLEFAVGVELAQLIIVTLVLLLGAIVIGLFRVSKRDWVMVGSAIVFGLVIPMVLERNPF